MASQSPIPPTPPSAGPSAREVTRLSVIVAITLIGLKAFALGASGSVSMLATLTDSALDLVGSLAVFFAVRWSAAPPDDDHRFGHGKGEAMAALVQAGLVFASALFIGREAIGRMVDPTPVSGGVIGVAVMLISMALTSFLVWRQRQAIAASGSLAVAGDRAHYVADLGANGVVLIGLVSGAFLGAPGLDAAAGLIVMIWLAWGAVGLLKQAADQLLDAVAPAEVQNRLVAAVTEDPRILGVHRLRTRVSGASLQAQMHVDLDADLSLKDAHDIVEAAEARVRSAFPGAEVILHPDPAGVTAASGGARPWDAPTR